jgi:type III restriction enzyme
VRLYNTRDGKWSGNKYKPGNTTIGEAQLIGRGARYFPFQLDETQDKYKRKFDDDLKNELRIIETLHYHCFQEPKYIQEIKTTLTEMGILPEKYVQRELFIKESFKKTEFWEKGVIFINDRIQNPRTEIFSLQGAKIRNNYQYEMRTGELREEVILDEKGKPRSSSAEKTKIKYKFIDFGENIIRSALDKFEFYRFDNLKKYFPHLKSIKEFISSHNYLGNVEVEISGLKEKVNNLMPDDKLKIALFVIKEISEQARVNTSEFVGTTLFKARMLREVFRDKILKIDNDDERAKGMQNINLQNTDWYAQNELYGTSEEREFISFIDGFIEEQLRQKYSDIALLRNEKFFQIFDFDEGRAFEPDFVMFLKKKNDGISIYQIFIEPKGDQFKDNRGRFENSKEGWKQKFLLEIENKADMDLKFENTHFKLIGLPFYNKSLEKEFKKAVENKLLK